MERHITADHEVRASLDQVAHILNYDLASLMGSRKTSPNNTPSTCLTEVEAELGGGRSLHQMVTVSLRPLSATTDPEARRWELSWQPPDGSRLVPSFRGVLEAKSAVDGTHLDLAGSYHPPLGPVGAFGDGLVGHRVARRTAASFLARLAQRIDRTAERRVTVAITPAPYPDDLRDKPLPAEAWIG